MTTETQTTGQETNTSQPKDISDPNISFTDYERMRRDGGKAEGTQTESAPEEKESSEQKEPSKSGGEDDEAKEEAKTNEESESESEEEADKEDDSEKDKPKKKGGFQRRIDKLNARVAAREQELEYWRQQALKGKDSGAENPEQKVELKQEAPGKPSPDDYDSHTEYVEALTDWKLEQREKEREAESQKSKLLSEQETLIKAHHERERSFAEKTPDYVEVITEFFEENPHISAAFEELVVTSENGPELMYELAKNREEFDRINKLPPLAAARALGQIESKLSLKTSSANKPEPKKLSKAPKPIEPVSGGKGSVTKSIDDPNISFAEYERIRNEQIRSKR